MQLHDGSCPTFRKTLNFTVSSDAPSTANPAAVFCSILARTGDKELCLDIAGENPAYGTPLLGYDCTGRWNQLFNLGANCTISAEQPAVVGRVRGNGGSSGDSGESVTLCLDAHHKTGVVVTAPCENLASRSSEQALLDVTGAGDATPERAASTGQRFQFMTADGRVFKEFMKQ